MRIAEKHIQKSRIMTDLLMNLRAPLENKNFWTEGIRNGTWIDECIKKPDNHENKPPISRTNLKQRKQEKFDLSLSAKLEKKLSYTEMNYGNASTIISQTLQPARRTSVSSNTSGGLISNEKCLDLIYNISLENDSEQPTGKTKNKKNYNKTTAGNNQNNNFSENFNSSNPTTFLSTSEMGSSDEEIKTKTKKSTTGRNNFRRLSSALLKKPQMYREKFDSIANLSIKTGHNNVDRDESFVEKKRNTSKRKGRNNNNEEEDEEDEEEETAPTETVDPKTEKIEEEEEEEGGGGVAEEGEGGGEAPKEAAQPTEPDAMDMEYLRSLVGGDTARPVELKHYNSTEFIGQIVKMRGGWRFNISFSEMAIVGDKNQVEVATAAEQMKLVNAEQKESEKKKRAEIKKTKNQAEFCKGKILNTFNRFVEKWCDEKTKFPEEEEDMEDYYLEEEEGGKGGGKCKTKKRKVRFSRYNSVAKKFGECDISLYYSPRRCQM